MLKTLIEKFPQKKNASFDFIGRRNYFYFFRGKFFSQRIHKFSPSLVTSVSWSIEYRYKRVKVAKTRSVSSGNVRLDPINASQF